MMPPAGGMYFYLREAYSPLWGFRYGGPCRRASSAQHCRGIRLPGYNMRYSGCVEPGAALPIKGARRFNMDLETAPDSAIQRQSLTSAVADKLRDQIIRGEIPEGAQLRQDAIANQYQVSRIPVREALRQLDAEGLIAIVPNRGALFPALAPDDIEELWGIRALLEPEVLRQSIPHLTEDDFSEPDAVLQKSVSELRREDHLSACGRLNWQS